MGSEMITKVYRDKAGKIVNIGDWDALVPMPAGVVESTADIVLLADGSPVENTPALYRQLRKAAYVAELSPVSRTVEDTLGDVVDVLIKKVAGADTGGEFDTLVGRIAAIKARYPKPS